MSQQAAHDFARRMRTDAAFRREALAAGDVDARARFARASGFDLSADELAAPSGALTDDELAAMTGGGSNIVETLGRACGPNTTIIPPHGEC